MKRKYYQPEVEIAQFASMTLMQAASGGGSHNNKMDMNDIFTDTQW